MPVEKQKLRIDERLKSLGTGYAAGSFLAVGNALLRITSDNGGTVHKSCDDGATWSFWSIMFEGGGPGRLTKDVETGLAVGTPGGELVWVYRDFENRMWEWDDQKICAKPTPRCDVWSIRSLDGGKTWVDRQRIMEGYCGALEDIIVTAAGNVVVPIQKYMPDPGRHVQYTYTSFDSAKTWERSNIIDLGGNGHHDGVFEGTVTQLEDGRLLMYMRTGWDRFWQAVSWNEGLNWFSLRPSNVPASSSPGFIQKLSSGLLVLVWNQLPEDVTPRPLHELKPMENADFGDRYRQSSQIPANWFRDALSIAFSDDEGSTWHNPVCIAKGKRLCYPQVFERRPGELWISFVAGQQWERNLYCAYEKDFV